MNQTAQLSTIIKAEAIRLGFPLVGITLPDPPAHFSVFARWLAEGRHASMGYLAGERSLSRRADPRRILPEARSILSVGLPYANPVSLPSQPGTGGVAAYAWGADYHDVLPARLQSLVEFVEAQTGQAVRRRAYTDTGPLLERDLAQRAGLGWIGKNTCLIHPRLGSYFLLGELLLDVDLEPDEPVAHDFCGSCRRCIEACSTDCILPDRTIDAGRCISYLTIENKGPVPLDLRRPMGDWIFGCDVCQAVCPWNIRFTSLPPDPELAPRAGIPRPDLREEIHLSPEAFNHKFRKFQSEGSAAGDGESSPILRPHRRGYLRNVAIAMGNLADPACLPDLAQALREEPEPLVRGHAAWAMAQIGGRSASKDLERALRADPDAYVVSEIKRALDK